MGGLYNLNRTVIKKKKKKKISFAFATELKRGQRQNAQVYNRDDR